jgi:uncharacterized protein (UPF0335 family)
MIRIGRVKNSSYKQYFKEGFAESQELVKQLNNEVGGYDQYLSETGLKRNLAGKEFSLARIYGGLANQHNMQGSATEESFEKFFTLTDGKDPITGEDLFKQNPTTVNKSTYLRIEINGVSHNIKLNDREIETQQFYKDGIKFNLNDHKDKISQKVETKNYEIDYYYNHVKHGRIMLSDEQIKSAVDNGKFNHNGKSVFFNKNNLDRYVHTEDEQKNKLVAIKLKSILDDNGKFIRHETLTELQNRLPSGQNLTSKTRWVEIDDLKIKQIKRSKLSPYSKSQLVEIPMRVAGLEIIHSLPKGISYLTNSNLVSDEIKAKLLNQYQASNQHTIQTEVLDRMTARTGAQGTGGNVEVMGSCYSQTHIETRAKQALMHQHNFISGVGVDKNGIARSIDTSDFFKTINGKYGISHHVIDVKITNDLFYNLRSNGFNLRVINDKEGKALSVDIDFGDPRLNKWIDDNKEMQKLVEAEIGRIVDKEKASINYKIDEFKKDNYIQSDSDQSLVKYRHGLEDEFNKFYEDTKTTKFFDRIHQRIKEDKGLTLSETEEKFTEDLIKAGFTEQNLLNINKNGMGNISGMIDIDSSEFMKGLLEKQVRISKEEIFIEYAKQSMGRYSNDELLVRVDQIINDRQLMVKLSDGMYSTVEKVIQHNENIVLKGVELLKSTNSNFKYEHSGIEVAIEKWQEKQGWNFSQDQRGAIQHILGQDNNLSQVIGAAGAGKSAVMKFCVDYIQTQTPSNKIYGATYTNKITQQMKEDVADSRTVDKLLIQLEKGSLKLDKSSILFVDEAGLLGLNHMSKIVDHCHKAGAKLVLIGDNSQINSVQAAASFNTLLENSDGNMARLTSIMRQKNEVHRDIALTLSGSNFYNEQSMNGTDLKQLNELMNVQLATGEFSKQGLEKIEEAGLIKFQKNREEMITNISGKYVDSISTGTDREEFQKNMKENIVLAGTNKTIDQLNDSIRSELITKGIVDSDSISVKNKTYNKTYQFSEGDYVVLTGKLKDKNGEVVENGESGFIKNIEKQDDKLFINIGMDNGKDRRLEVTEETDLRHNYSSSMHRSQGRTVDNAIVLLEQGSESVVNSNTLYVASTRHRNEIDYFSLEREWVTTKSQFCRDGRNENLDTNMSDLEAAKSQLQTLNKEHEQKQSINLNNPIELDISMKLRQDNLQAMSELREYEKENGIKPKQSNGIKSNVKDMIDGELNKVNEKINPPISKEIENWTEAVKLRSDLQNVDKNNEYSKTGKTVALKEANIIQAIDRLENDFKKITAGLNKIENIEVLYQYNAETNKFISDVVSSNKYIGYDVKTKQQEYYKRIPSEIKELIKPLEKISQDNKPVVNNELTKKKVKGLSI